MAAIITEKFRKNNTLTLLSDIESQNYFIGIGKSDDWYESLNINSTSPFPIGTHADEINVRNNLISLVKIDNANIGVVIPKVIADSTLTYKTYSPYDSSCFYAETITVDSVPTLHNPCYAISGDNIFLCLYALSTPSSNTFATYLSPTYGTYSIGKYKWAYLGTITTSALNSNQFVKITNDNASAATSATNAVKGYIYGFQVINTGTGYSDASNATVTITGTNLSGATVTETLNNVIVKTANNGITSIDISVSGMSVNKYKIASATISGAGTGAVIAPLIAPVNGFGYSLIEDLPSWYVGVLANANDDDTSIFVDYRQISLLKNPTVTLVGDATSVNTLRSFNVSSIAAINIGDSITQSGKGIGRVSYISGSTIYYTPSVKYGFVAPTTSTVTIGTATPTISAINTSPYDFISGDVVYLENRGAISRVAHQNEEIKIIIQL